MPSLAIEIDIRRPAHHAMRVGANVPHADVVAPDDGNIGFLVSGAGRSERAKERRTSVSSDKP